jgi:hypothetical protein
VEILSSKFRGGGGMKLEMWLELKRMGPTELSKRLIERFGDSPSKQALSNIAKGKSQASLEVALMLKEVTNGDLDLWKLVSNPKYVGSSPLVKGIEEGPPDTGDLSDVDDLLNSL